MSSTGTFRGTPKNRGQAQYTNSPSAIPRPALEHVASQSDAGTSTLSASRAKMSKRDEVNILEGSGFAAGVILTPNRQSGERSRPT
jgi:hypothetical protein